MTTETAAAGVGGRPRQVSPAERRQGFAVVLKVNSVSGEGGETAFRSRVLMRCREGAAEGNMNRELAGKITARQKLNNVS